MCVDVLKPRVAWLAMRTAHRHWLLSVLFLLQPIVGLKLNRLCPFNHDVDCKDPANCANACESVTRNAAQNLLVGKPLDGLTFDSIRHALTQSINHSRARALTLAHPCTHCRTHTRTCTHALAHARTCARTHSGRKRNGLHGAAHLQRRLLTSTISASPTACLLRLCQHAGTRKRE